MRRGFFGVALCGPKHETNVAGSMRAAHCFGANLIVIGASRVVRMPANTSKAEKHVPAIVAPDPLAVLPVGCTAVAVEVDGDCSLPLFEHPERALYVFGPEDGSIPHDVRKRCARSVRIPTAFCLNLAQAVAVVLYDREAKR